MHSLHCRYISLSIDITNQQCVDPSQIACKYNQVKVTITIVVTLNSLSTNNPSNEQLANNPTITKPLLSQERVRRHIVQYLKSTLKGLIYLLTLATERSEFIFVWCVPSFPIKRILKMVDIFVSANLTTLAYAYQKTAFISRSLQLEPIVILMKCKSLLVIMV